MSERVDKREQGGDRVQAAAEWYMQLQAGELSAAELENWNQWSRDPANRQAFDGIARLSQLATGLKGVRFEVAPPRRRPVKWLAAAAVVLIALGAAVTLQQVRFGSPTVYRTAIAEHRTVQLPDGSSMLLGAKTSVSVGFTRDVRQITLDGGEALFTVAVDKHRPFAVVAGNGTITALGTVFNVHREEDRVVVKVADGRVRLARSPNEVMATLDKGQEVIYREAGPPSRIESIEPQEAAVWREGRLQYRDETLKYVAADVNRYSGRRIVFADPAAEGLLYTGTVYRDRIDEWLHGLADLYPLEIEQTDANRVLVRSLSAR